MIGAKRVGTKVVVNFADRSHFDPCLIVLLEYVLSFKRGSERLTGRRTDR